MTATTQSQRREPDGASALRSIRRSSSDGLGGLMWWSRVIKSFFAGAGQLGMEHWNTGMVEWWGLRNAFTRGYPRSPAVECVYPRLPLDFRFEAERGRRRRRPVVGVE